MLTHHKPLHNKLSRSNTRITLLEYCEKKYFLNYYTFSLKKINHDLRKQALILKKLKSLEMWMGEKTHFLISDYLNLLKSHLPSPAEINTLKDQIAQEMRKEFHISKTKNYKELDFSKRGGLSEHYYQEDIDEFLEPTIQKVHGNLDALITSPRIPKLQNFFQQAYSTYIENPKNPDFESMKVEIDKLNNFKDINIMASPDFGVIFHDKSYFILDRKSGKKPLDQIDISDQIKVYALKLLLKTQGNTKLEKTKIHGYEIYLPSMQKY